MKRPIFAVSLLGAILHAPGAATENAILTLQHVGSGYSVTFSDEPLIALPQKRFETATIWTEVTLELSGPSLKTLIEKAQMIRCDVALNAINEYNIVLPLDKIEDDAPFSVRDKGPLWVVFPYDDVSRCNNEEYFALNVWQTNRLNVLSR